MTTRRGFLEGFTLGAVGGLAALATVGIGSVLAGAKCEKLTFDLGKDAREAYADTIRETMHRMAQDAVGKPEKSKELALLKLYVDTVREYHDKDNVQFGYGTFCGPTSEYTSVVDSVHWYVYGMWGATRDPTYWAQRNDGEWYII